MGKIERDGADMGSRDGSALHYGLGMTFEELSCFWLEFLPGCCPHVLMCS